MNRVLCQRAEIPLKLTGLTAARDFFSGCLAEQKVNKESLWVAHLDDEARCFICHGISAMQAASTFRFAISSSMRRGMEASRSCSRTTTRAAIPGRASQTFGRPVVWRPSPRPWTASSSIT